MENFLRLLNGPSEVETVSTSCISILQCQYSDSTSNLVLTSAVLLQLLFSFQPGRKIRFPETQLHLQRDRSFRSMMISTSQRYRLVLQHVSCAGPTDGVHHRRVRSVRKAQNPQPFEIGQCIRRVGLVLILVRYELPSNS